MGERRLIMPVYLTESDISSELAGCGSVLIVPCRFCPAASFAVHTGEVYIDFPRKRFRTDSYERYIEGMKSGLESTGVKVDVFKSHLLHQFVLCMWTKRRRQQLVDRARRYEAVVVLGCEAAVQTIRDSLGASGCRVVSGMTSGGIMSIKPSFSLPCAISLEIESVSPATSPGAAVAEAAETVGTRA
jgi:hypothetical protein